VKLTDLEPKFCKLTDHPNDGSWRDDATFDNNDGLMFLCPLCWTKNKGPISTHRVICWKPHVPAHISPGPGRWNQTGTGLADLSLVAGSSSVKLEGGCAWHGHITAGEIKGGF
jgi:hypothetical protein